MFSWSKYVRIGCCSRSRMTFFSRLCYKLEIHFFIQNKLSLFLCLCLSCTANQICNSSVNRYIHYNVSGFKYMLTSLSLLSHLWYQTDFQFLLDFKSIIDIFVLSVMLEILNNFSQRIFSLNEIDTRILLFNEKVVHKYIQ